MVETLKFCVTFCTVLISICQGDLHPPTNLTYEWLDPLTVNLSWKRPRDLHQHCEIKHVIWLNKKMGTTRKSHYLAELLTESAAQWNCSVLTQRKCRGQMSNSSVTKLVIEPLQPPVVVADFRCLLSYSDMNCSWTSNQSSPVLLFHRQCGETKELLRKGFGNCSLTYELGERTVCSLKGNFFQKNICMMATTPLGIQTFRPKRDLFLPPLNISKQDTNFSLTWAAFNPDSDCLHYNICYSACNQPKICRVYFKFSEIPFNESCSYRFQYRLQTTDHCGKLHSNWSDEIIYYRFFNQALIVVAIVIPLFVSACVVLFCICIRRHKNIFCPEIPDPSAILKEMMTDRQIKPNISTYVPVQETVEQLFIVPHIPHNSEPVTT